MPVLEELCRFGRHWQMRLENTLPDILYCRFYPSTTLGGGVDKAISVFFVSLGETKNLNLLRCEIQYYDIMI